MSWIKANPWTMVIAAVVMLAAIVGVIYALATHKARQAARDKGLMVRDDHELAWRLSDLPLAVWFHPGLPLALRAAWELAATTFEAAVGRDLFMKGLVAPGALDLGKLPQGNVAVVPNDGQADLASDSGRTEHKFDTRDGRILSALVTLPVATRGGLSKHVALHEAGHVLGLDHDDVTDSIMFPTLSMRRDPGKLSPADTAVLRERYVRG